MGGSDKCDGRLQMTCWSVIRGAVGLCSLGRGSCEEDFFFYWGKGGFRKKLLAVRKMNSCSVIKVGG